MALNLGHRKTSGCEPLRHKRGPTREGEGVAAKTIGIGEFKKTVTWGKQENRVKRTREKVNWGTSGTEKKKKKSGKVRKLERKGKQGSGGERTEAAVCCSTERCAWADSVLSLCRVFTHLSLTA